MDDILKLTKSSSVSQAVVSDILTYKLEIRNISKQIIKDVIVKDLLPEELKFIIGSIKIDYVSDSYSNIISGVNIGNLEPESIKIVTFDAQIVKRLYDSVSNTAIAEFKYTQNNQTQYNSTKSNEVIVLIKNPKVILLKEADKESVQLGDEINYKLTISNTGDLDVENVFLIDSILNLVTLVDGSFEVDNTPVNSVELNKGVSLKDLPVGEQRIIKYKVKVESGACSGKIFNKAIVKYSYTLPDGFKNYKQSNESSVYIDMAISSFKQLNIEKYINIHSQNIPLKDINDIKATIEINKSNVIKTPILKSSEGQNLSGYKLVVHGTINQIIEYIACEPTQSIHSTNYSCPFSTYIILPKDFKVGNKIDIQPNMEDIYFEVINEKCFFENINLLLVAKILCI